MKRSTRLLVLLAAFEAVLAIIWWWLMSGLWSGELSQTGGNTAAAAETVSSTIGGVMGVLAGVFLITVFVLRRKGA